MKKISLQIIIIVTFGLSLFSSCNKFLDIKSEDFLTSEEYYENDRQLHAALNAVYSVLGDYRLYGRDMLRMGLDADDGFYNVVNTLSGVEIYDVAAADTKIGNFWTACYLGIDRANSLLANVDRSDAISVGVRDQIKGEALFLRSYFYFLLVSNFGGVPYVTQNTQVVHIPRTAPELIYANIVSDMELAESLVLPIKEIGYGGRVSKSAVRGILARVNLFIAGQPVNDQSRYAEARKWAKMVIDDAEAAHELNPDFSQVFINYAADKYDIKESIWEVEFYGNHQDVYREGGQIGAYNGIRYIGMTVNGERVMDPNYGYSLGMVNASGTLWDKYEDPGSLVSPDLRRDWAIAPFSVSGVPAVEKPRTIEQIYERNCGKYRREYEVLLPRDHQYTPINFPLLRYADVLLMFAEADNHVNGGPTQDSYQAINSVRRRGYGLPMGQTAPGVDLQGLDQEKFLKELQNERSRELSFEYLRKGDLVRWGIFWDKMEDALDRAEQSGLQSSMSHALTYFKNVSKRDALWPIPSYERGVNLKLDQNPGW
ncbi:RagB/SusD family nutrient uptake outer membrane protein [Sphingobacterium paucimobilis]|nr:RagB/SusD family nutrient uptake outer membrane protein [Sphingobacterium paucimobilis]